MNRRFRRGMFVLIAVAMIATVAFCAAKFTRQEKEMSHNINTPPTADEISKLPPDGGEKYNRLVHESSPYLLQHASNPVDWYPWGQEAFAKARKENKPIFLSIGYSTCHWCHVMAHESFEHDDVAEILNANYVSIKVDREERPDVDRIYMLATQMLTGRGGWPNSLWLTPDGKPWFAGTYYPREDRFNRPGFKTILTRLAETWRTQRSDVETQAQRIAGAMKHYSSAARIEGGGKLSYALLEASTAQLKQTFDAKLGGFGGAPKFPPHGALRVLLSEYRRTNDKALLGMAVKTLDAMARGGIHDHIGGGFHRYSTDVRWLTPHFEKMLYDNAQLTRAYVDAYLITGDENHKRVAEDICDWVLREMTDEAGGFYSAIDADSEGEEGKFYVWTRDEILAVLSGEEGNVFCDVYGVTKKGNFRDEASGRITGANILHLPKAIPAELAERLAAGRAKLLASRDQRIRPHLDDKVLVSWNALMISSLAYAGRHLDEPRYIAAAERSADFILSRMQKDGRLLRSYRLGQAKLGAFLDDYAFLAGALIDLHEATGEKRRLAEAERLVEVMLKHYRDPVDGGFFFTADDHEELLARTKDPMDAAIPAGNAIAAEVLVRLAGHTGRKEYLDVAKQTLETFAGFMERIPTGTNYMLVASEQYLAATKQAQPAIP